MLGEPERGGGHYNPNRYVQRKVYYCSSSVCFSHPETFCECCLYCSQQEGRKMEELWNTVGIILNGGPLARRYMPTHR